MTDNSHTEVVNKVERAIKSFTDDRKETFSNNLCEQLKVLSSKLDPKRQQQLSCLFGPSGCQ